MRRNKSMLFTDALLIAPPRDGSNVTTYYYMQIYLKNAWRRPTLTGGNPQLPLALRSLTSVFGMGTGVTFSPSSPNYLIVKVYSLKTR